MFRPTQPGHKEGIEQLKNLISALEKQLSGEQEESRMYRSMVPQAYSSMTALNVDRPDIAQVRNEFDALSDAQQNEREAIRRIIEKLKIVLTTHSSPIESFYEGYVPEQDTGPAKPGTKAMVECEQECAGVFNEDKYNECISRCISRKSQRRLM